MGHIFEREKTLNNSCLLFILQCTLYNISSTNKLYACVPSLIMDPCRTAVSRYVWRMCEIKIPPPKKDKGYLEQARQRE